MATQRTAHILTALATTLSFLCGGCVVVEERKLKAEEHIELEFEEVTRAYGFIKLDGVCVEKDSSLDYELSDHLKKTIEQLLQGTTSSDDQSEKTDIPQISSDKIPG